MNQESRIVKIETVIEHLSYVLDRGDKRFDEVEKILQTLDEKFDKKFEALDNKIEKLSDKVEIGRKEAWSQMRWVLAFIIALFASPLFSSVLNYIHSLTTK